MRPTLRYFPVMDLAYLTRARHGLLFGLGAAALILAASLADPWAYAHLTFPRVNDQDWGRLLRTMGFLPLWLLAGIALYQSSATPSGQRHALLLMAAPTLSGALGQVLKFLIRRERPGLNAGAYVFRDFGDHPFNTVGLGMPSGHAIVAFGACAILARLWPRARLIWYGLAAGCALTRVLARAHFLSDVTVAGLAGWTVAALLWHRYAPAPA